MGREFRVRCIWLCPIVSNALFKSSITIQPSDLVDLACLKTPFINEAFIWVPDIPTMKPL